MSTTKRFIPIQASLERILDTTSENKIPIQDGKVLYTTDGSLSFFDLSGVRYLKASLAAVENLEVEENEKRTKKLASFKGGLSVVKSPTEGYQIFYTDSSGEVNYLAGGVSSDTTDEEKIVNDLRRDLSHYFMDVYNPGGINISLYDMFVNKPTGTVALLFFNGVLESTAQKGFRFMQNTTPIISFYSTAGLSANMSFTCKIIKISESMLIIHAYKGDTFAPSETTLAITYHTQVQTMTLENTSKITYGVGTSYGGDLFGTLRVKFI